MIELEHDLMTAEDCELRTMLELIEDDPSVALLKGVSVACLYQNTKELLEAREEIRRLKGEV